MNIIYLCPEYNIPAGGVKVIYRHVELISHMLKDNAQHKAYILHPFQHSFKCTWFEHSVQFKTDNNYSKEEDFFIVPDIWASSFGTYFAQKGFRYALFIQGGYLMMNWDKTTIIDSFQNAEIILTISDDTTECVKLAFPNVADRIQQVRLSIERAKFIADGPKENLITYMPRRLPDHAKMLNFILSDSLPPDWRIEPIDGLDDKGVAKLLSRSKIFLSLSSCEGLGLPPIEAALSGNFVIGYTGEGGKEYWDRNIFTEIQCGDILSFSRAVHKTINQLDQIDPEVHRLSIEVLAARYSQSAERQAMQKFLNLLQVSD